MVEWLIANWIAASGAIASIVAAGLLIWDKVKPAPMPFDGEFRVGFIPGESHAHAMLIVRRPLLGAIEIESLSAKGWELGFEEMDHTEQWDPKPTGRFGWAPVMRHKLEVGRAGAHQEGSLWSFSFSMRPSPINPRSANAQKIIRLVLKARFRSARVLRRTITMESNRMD